MRSPKLAPSNLLLSCSLSFFASVAVPACSDDGPGDDAETEQDPGESAGALTASDMNCTRESQPAYQGGQRIGDVDVVKIGEKKVTLKTGNAFLKLQQAAQEKGISVTINSGFRTMSEQEYFYNCYQTGSCNNGNLAAKPGYSNHQNGRALDLGTSSRSKLNSLIEELGVDWRRTVPSEDWHYEYFGEDPGGPCDNGSRPSTTTRPPAATDQPQPQSPPAAAARGCQSPTVGTEVADLACVQAPSNREWYQCHDAAWYAADETQGPYGPCSKKYPLQ